MSGCHGWWLLPLISPIYFPTIGKYKVTLKAFNTVGCFAYTDYIIVTCGVTANFIPIKKQLFQT
jgi:hypothetical protein